MTPSEPLASRPAGSAGTLAWSRVFAAQVARHRIGAYPVSASNRGRLVLADTLAAIAAGAREPEVKRLTACFADPAGTATMVASGGARARPDDAAFVNAVAGTSAEMDEGHYGAGFHPAIHVVPAALASAEGLGASGGALLDAIVLGYEAAARVGRASRLRPAVHSHGTFGVIGAAVATARLRGFDAGRMAKAINMAASLATATSRTAPLAGGTIRNVYAGVASRNGMLACDLAQAGFEGEDDAIDIAFGAVLGTAFDPAAVVGAWGEAWEIERNYFKFAASCKDTQGALHALADLQARLGPFAADAVSAIRIETFAGAAALCEPRPQTSLAARFSIPFVVAAQLVRGSAGIDDFGPDALQDARILGLAPRITVAEDPAFTERCPVSLTRMHLSLHDGTSATTEVEGSLGDFDRPLDPSLLERKFESLTAGIWEPGLRIRERCLALSTMADIRSLADDLG